MIVVWQSLGHFFCNVRSSVDIIGKNEARFKIGREQGG
jgi:hypothetical protein